MAKRICVLGAGGFIGSHLVKYLVGKGHWVKGVDIKYPEFEKTTADTFQIYDLRQPMTALFWGIDEVYHLAADMGGIGYIETHKADIVYNNTMINMNVLDNARKMEVKKLLFTSSACVYPGYLQNYVFPQNGENLWITHEELYTGKPLKEEDAYPADAEDGYGWEKLMMERACRHFREDYGLQTYIARFHNIYGEKGAYDGGREKSPAALCRKIAANETDLEIWGDGTQTRSYCYISDCVEALYRLMNSDYHEPLNIGTDRLVSINELADIIMKIAGKKLTKVYDLSKPRGVMGRNADITKAKQILGWQPEVSLEKGLTTTYKWIKQKLTK